MEGRVDAWWRASVPGNFPVSPRLKKHNPRLVAIAVERRDDLQGDLRDHIAWRASASISSQDLPPGAGRDVIMVTDDDAFAMVRAGCRRGAAGWFQLRGVVYAALEVARKLGPGKRIATVIPELSRAVSSKNISRAVSRLSRRK